VDYLPIFLKLTDEPCLVVGGGETAQRKIDLLLRARAQITVVAPDITNHIHTLVKRGRIDYIRDQFYDEYLDKTRIVIIATNNIDTNKRVAAAARKLRLPINVVDQPALCDFIIPSIVDRSPVIVAVGTGGTSPVLARILRAKLETIIPASYGQLAILARDFRAKVRSKLPTTQQRRAFWEQVFQGPIAEMMFSGKENKARHLLNKLLNSADPHSFKQGEVYLVGAGPGDPDLLTFRALRLMQQADVVLYDRLVSDGVLDLVRREADRIYVGKKRAQHEVPQNKINQLLVDLAKSGKRVLRLKGGDPFIFGRGSEEIEDLFHNGIPFQVIPGITAASGCASYAGIPLTHRDFAQSCVFVTGHLQSENLELNWKQLCQPSQTVVVYMSLTGLDTICKQMINHGSPAHLPAALIQQGTTSDQRVVCGTLNTLPGLVSKLKIKPPTLLIIGEVVQLHSMLNWFQPGQSELGTLQLGNTG